MSVLALMCHRLHGAEVGEAKGMVLPRVIVSTDIGGTDFDDFQSMVHLLVHGDRCDIEGLVSSPYGGGRKEQILKVIDYYQHDYANLHSYSDHYPTAEKLRSITKQGALDSAGLDGFSHPTEGSEWIIQCARRTDTRPLWLLVWGGIEDVAQALHDDPKIQSKLRIYFIGGPNKKRCPTAYDYIARNHPDVWIIEANSTYYGWFTGGNQKGDLGNTTFVTTHVNGRGALGDYFASGIVFRGQVQSSWKMGDTPSLAYLLGKTPEDPSKESWGGCFVRAWDRRKYIFEHAPTITDEVETYSIVEIIYRQASPVGTTARLATSGQDFPGFADSSGAWHFLLSPNDAKRWDYVIQSTDPQLNGKTGGFTTKWPSPGQSACLRYANWWTDDQDPAATEGVKRGAKHVNQWREKFLRDFAELMKRCQSPAPHP